MSARRSVLAVVALTTAAVLVQPSPASADDQEAGGHGRHGPELIVFTGETATDQQLWTIRPNGTHARQITHVDGAAVDPDWSPDGRTIVFEWDLPNDAGAQIAFVDADGDHLRTLPITQPGCVDANPAFTADGRSVVYEHFDCAADDALFVRSVDGTGQPQRLTAAGTDGYTEPNPSPDGQLLSYIRTAGGVEFQQALTVSDIDGSEPRDLLPPSEDVAVKTGWSPDSERIVLTTDANAIGDAPLEANLATIAADGSDLTYLTHFTGGHQSAFAGSYSPDGRRIVYRLEDSDAGDSALWTIRPDGTHARELFHRDGLRARFVDWGGALCGRQPAEHA
jgi:Tol biopolymer transport system component